jgi:sugar lactone lactonase YvrE
MREHLKRGFLLTGAVLAVAALVLLRLLTANGAFAGVHPQPLANCTSTPLAGPATDVEVDRASGVAYLAVFDSGAASDDPLLNGTILKLDLKQPDAQPATAIADAPRSFRPQGLSLWTQVDEPARLFVVNRPLDNASNEQETVEIFEVEADGLFHHLKTVSDPLFVHAHDVAAVGAEQFYVTNDRGAQNLLTRAVEAVIRPGWSNVLYYDGAHASIAVSDRVFATGITVSADGLRLYFAEAGARELLIFDRDTLTGSLYWSSLIEVGGAPAKLDIAEDGALWAAVQPDSWALKRSFASGRVAPTVILRFKAPVNGFSKAQTVYANDGHEFSGGMAAVAHEGRMLVGSVTEKRLFSCPVPTGS